MRERQREKGRKEGKKGRKRRREDGETLCISTSKKNIFKVGFSSNIPHFGGCSIM
jgi:hypothetical protein